VEEPVWTVQREGPEDSDFDDGPQAGTSVAVSKKMATSSLTSLDSGGRYREWFYLLIGLSLVPLVLSTLSPAHDSELDRIKQSIHAHPEVEQTLQDMEEHGTLRSLSSAGLLKLFPGHRLDGAFLANDSETHWLFAMLAAGAFFATGIFLLPRSPTKPKHAFLTGLFTGTAGVLLLLAIQFIADHMRGRIYVPRSILGLIVLLLKGIQLSYDLANDPDSGFFPSAIGFTLGVGLCEELCKALPILWHFRTKGTLDWRGACVWGFLSGAGFGVAEAIMYCGDFYNGIEGGDAYLVRFVSCIALHGIWAAAAAIFISRHPMLIQNGEEWWNVLLGAAALVSVPMVLHGLYDTMLKKEMPGSALVVAIISFAWLVFQIERSRREEDSAPAVRAWAR
jgi:RsiW-degrading membrane proteinase PrsW (M82 family)